MALLDDILDVEVPVGLRISPAGDKVAYYTQAACDGAGGAEPRRSTIWMADVGRARSARRLTDGTYYDRRPRWAPDGRSVFFLSDREAPGQASAIYRLALEDGDDCPSEWPEDWGEPDFSYRPRGSLMPLTWPGGRVIQTFKTFELSLGGGSVGWMPGPVGNDDDDDDDDSGPPPAFVVRARRNEDCRSYGGRGFYTTWADAHPGAYDRIGNPPPWSGHVADFAWVGGGGGERALLFARRMPDADSAHLHGTEFWTSDDDERTLVCRVPLHAWSPVWAGGRMHFLSWAVPGDASSGVAIYEIDLPPGPMRSGEAAAEAAACTKIWAADSTRCAVHLAPVVGGGGGGHQDVLVHLQEGTRETLRLLRADRTLLVQQAAILDAAAAAEVKEEEADDGTGTGTGTGTGRPATAVVAIVQGSLDRPSEVFSVGAGGGEPVQLSDLGAAFAAKHGGGAPLGATSVLECPTADGRGTVDGLFFAPAAAAATVLPHPTVVLLPDGPYGGRATEAFGAAAGRSGGGLFDPDSPGYNDDAEHGDGPWHWAPLLVPLLLRAGVAVLQVGGRSSVLPPAPAAGDWDEVAYADVVALMDAAVCGGHADPARLVAAGWGAAAGHLAYLAAVRSGAGGDDRARRFAGCVAGAAACDLDALAVVSDCGCAQAARRGRAVSWQEEGEDREEREEETPQPAAPARAASALWELAAVARAGGALPPLLVLHGERDARVPLSQARGFRRAADAARLPPPLPALVTYPGQGHRLRRRACVRDAAGRVVRFACRHLGVPADLDAIVGDAGESSE